MDTTELEMALKEWGDEEEDSRLPSAEELTAIHEASSEMSVARRSKCQATGVDEVVGAAAKRRKAMRNEGNPDQSSFNLVDDASVIPNLNDVGISLGSDDASISSSLVSIKKNVVGCEQVVVPCSLKEKVLEQEEKDLLEEEELEKLFLKNICSNIMEEVMDFESDRDVVLSSAHNSKKGSRRGEYKSYSR
jgi:hypothetical protein